MNAKTVILVLVGIALAYVAWQYFKKPSTDETGDSLKILPTVEEIMTKGYDADEAKQILASLEAGRSVNY